MHRYRIPFRVSGMTPARFDALNTRAAALIREGKTVINLGQALPHFGPPPSAIRAARDGLAQRDVHVYSEDAGRRSLREALCTRLFESHGIDATPDEVIITAGGNQAFALAAMSLLDSGDEVLLPAPYFVNHEMMLRGVGAVAKPVSVSEQDRFAVRWSDLAPQVTPRTRAVVFCNPSNPTGAVTRECDQREIVCELAARGIVAIVDETYMHFVYEEQRHASAAAVPDWRDAVVLVNTFSKSFGMTGWRIGYMIAPPDVCAQAIKIQDAMVICAPAIAQVAVEATIRHDWTYPLSFRDEFAARRSILMRELSSIPHLRWTPTDGAFFAFVRVDGCTDSDRLADELLEQTQVVTIPGRTFGEAGEGYLRISYGAVDARDLKESMSRLRRFFDRWSP
jgi:aspartate/methionine/tyrosine aminotransferase